MTDDTSPDGRSVRPYLDRPPVPAQAGDPTVSPLRPYLLTSGRAEPVDDSLEIEAQVLTSKLNSALQGGLAFEHQDIVTLCATPVSVAEVAAKLRLHIGVARVLVADLAAAGYLVVRRPATGLPDDLEMIEKVIRGLQDIR